MNSDTLTAPLVDLIAVLPAMSLPAGRESIGNGIDERGHWWVQFSLDLSDPLALRVVQELAWILNDLSIEERLPTVFMPVSPPPYLNGGTAFLSWVIENFDPGFSPSDCADALRSRLPDPIDDRNAWHLEDDLG